MCFFLYYKYYKYYNWPFWSFFGTILALSGPKETKRAEWYTPKAAPQLQVQPPRWVSPLRRHRPYVHHPAGTHIWHGTPPRLMPMGDTLGRYSPISGGNTIRRCYYGKKNIFMRMSVAAYTATICFSVIRDDSLHNYNLSFRGQARQPQAGSQPRRAHSFFPLSAAIEEKGVVSTLVEWAFGFIRMCHKYLALSTA